MVREKEKSSAGWLVLCGFLLGLAGLYFFLRVTASALGRLVSLPMGDDSWSSLLFLVVVAFLTMSLIQVIRSVAPIRGWFHRRQIEHWCLLTEQVIQKSKGLKPVPRQQNDADEAASEEERVRKDIEERVQKDVQGLIRLANADDSAAFFDAPIEQVCGQLSAVAEFLLSELPVMQSGKLDTGASSLPDVEMRDSEGHARLLAVLTGKNWVMRAGQLLRLTWDDEPTPTPPLQAGVVEADPRGKLGYYVQRSLDQLQIKVSSRWQRCLRLSAVTISSAIALSALEVIRPLVKASLEQQSLTNPFLEGLVSALTAVLAGVVSGYLATVFRDAVAIVERMRRG